MKPFPKYALESRAAHIADILKAIHPSQRVEFIGLIAHHVTDGGSMALGVLFEKMKLEYAATIERDERG